MGVVVSGNTIDNNSVGFVDFRCQCFVIGNTISNNLVGIVFNGHTFHNIFINNTLYQALAYCTELGCSAQALWDNGYPSGGNYWSDYVAVDNCSGLNQDVCPDADGIADLPRIFSCPTCRVGVDRYPLMRPFAPLVSGTVRFEPTSIASQNAATYLTAVIGIPQGFNASNLIPSSIRLNQTIVAARVTPLFQPNKAPVLIVAFNMTQVKALLSNQGLYVLKISGNILTSKNFRPFEATSTIRLLPA